MVAALVFFFRIMKKGGTMWAHFPKIVATPSQAILNIALVAFSVNGHSRDAVPLRIENKGSSRNQLKPWEYSGIPG